MIEQGRITGLVVAEWRRDGWLIHRSVTANLVTQVGDEYYGERAAGIATPPDQVTGMKLGTGTAVPTKTGIDAELGTYLADSHQAIDAAYPQSALEGTARRISWRAVYAAGKATTASNITEVVLINDVLADATSPAANTIARALLASPAPKAEGDSLTVTWHHDLEGA